FRRGNVPFVLAATFRARLFLFPVDCSLFPLYYPLLFHQQLDKSEFPVPLNNAPKISFPFGARTLPRQTCIPGKELPHAHHRAPRDDK
ncbi:MAG: hypothetical protein IKF98_13530, partial [Clostridia bacterium]|nr:hypothetical protein [Clostridia bacterium]